MTIVITGGGISGAGSPIVGPKAIKDKWDAAREAQLYFSLELSEDKVCGNNDFNFYAKDRLPSHVQELYDKFTRFVSLFYKFLECEQNIGDLALLKDIDEAPDELMKIFKKIYAVGLPN